jgi:O-antigen/teichoic acid export membrane protein
LTYQADLEGFALLDFVEGCSSSVRPGTHLSFRKPRRTRLALSRRPLDEPRPDVVVAPAELLATAATEAPPPAPVRTGVLGGSLVLMVSMVFVGVGNYGFSLALAWFLPSKQFSQVASASTLMLIVVTASYSMLPWVVARAVARSGPGSAERAEAIQFALVAAPVLGLVAGAIAAGLAAPYAPLGVTFLLVVTSVAFFVAGVGSGYQLGTQRFALLGALNILEVVIKFGAGLGFVAIGWGATGAFAGTTLGALMWAIASFYFLRHDLGLMRKRPSLALVKQLIGIGLTQTLVTILCTADIIIGSITIGAAGGLAVYQAMLVFSRVPTFIASGVSTVVYPKMTRDEKGQGRTVSEAVSLYLQCAVVASAVVATIPAGFLRLIVPHTYAGGTRLLLPLSLAGFAGGLLNLSTTFLQAQLIFKRVLIVLVAGTVLVAVLYPTISRTVELLAWCAFGVLGLVAAVIYLQTCRLFGTARLETKVLVYAVAFGALYEALHWAARASVPIWIGSAVVIGFGFVFVFVILPLRRDRSSGAIDRSGLFRK